MFNIDFQSRIPIYEQIISQVERYIALGILKNNEQLPSVRQVAFDLGINPNTIQKAYMELEHKDIITTIAGKGSYVSSNVNQVITNRINNIVIGIKDDIELLKSMGLDSKQIKDKLFKD